MQLIGGRNPISTDFWDIGEGQRTGGAALEVAFKHGRIACVFLRLPKQVWGSSLKDRQAFPHHFKCSQARSIAVTCADVPTGTSIR